MNRSLPVQGDTPGVPGFQQYQYEFTRHLRDPQTHRPPSGVSSKRVRVYVALLRNKIADSLLSCFPVTRQLLGKRSWNGLVGQFIAGHRCLSPLYRQIPDEFVAFLQNKKSESSDPPFLVELAHYEWMELALSIAVDESIGPSIRPERDGLDGSVAFSSTLQLLGYAYPVQRISPGQSGWRKWKAWRSQPHAHLLESTFLLGFRDRNDEVRFIEINPATARLIELLADDKLSVRQALLQLADELNAPDPQTVVDFGIDALSKLRDQGAILGTRGLSSPQALME